jgi:hypothetical protein
MQLFGFDFGGGGGDPTDSGVKKEEPKTYKVPEDRAIGRPHMMGWLDLLAEDEELGLKEDTFEADEWEEVKS